ncbi:hypothetical protein PSAC2689_40307 [Paraburkholderia sacchari]|uniref:hypothetical protein n=1 Tax=Paraburkholderia sacchari TaxID=159450 RepID=UPI0039A5A3B1
MFEYYYFPQSISNPNDTPSDQLDEVVLFSLIPPWEVFAAQGGSTEGACGVLHFDEPAVSDCVEDEQYCIKCGGDCGDTCRCAIEPRTQKEIYDAWTSVSSQIWYFRFTCLLQKVESGDVKIVSEAEWHQIGCRNNRNCIVDHIWARTVEWAARVKSELGEDNCQPLTEFELGMLHGKLAAFRWNDGYEWDELDV